MLKTPITNGKTANEEKKGDSQTSFRDVLD